MTDFPPSKTPITAGGSVLYPRLSDAEIESIMQHVAEHDKTGTEIGRDRMLHIATYWRNAADNYESAVLKAIAIQGRCHVMELLREVSRLRRIVDALPKTADGVPLRPCPKGPGTDEPGYVGFYPCKHDDEDPNG